MTKEAAELLRKALELSASERADLAGNLIDSLDDTVDEGAEEAWQQEIARRVEEVRAGKAILVPWEEVRRRVSAKLGHGR